MATTKQTQAAKRNIRKAQKAATRKRTIANLPKSTRRALQTEGGKARAGAARPGTHSRIAIGSSSTKSRKKGIAGRSKMGKGQLIEAIRKGG